RMIPALGWQSIFYLGGIVPLMLVPVLMAALPESIRYLVAQGARSARIARVLGRISPGAAYRRISLHHAGIGVARVSGWAFVQEWTGCVYRIRLCNIGDEGRQGQAVM